MKNVWKWVLIGILSISLICVVYKSRDIFMEKPFKVITLHKKSIVLNETNVPFLDTIVHLGLEELNIPETVVMLKPLNLNQFADSESEIKAYVVDISGKYVIYIQSMGRKESILVLSHEMIHISQYNSGKISLTDSGVIWKKAMLYPFNTPYDKRPWEIEAFALQGEMNVKISKQLY